MSRVGTSGDDNPDVRVYLPEHSDRVRAGHGGHIQISQNQVDFVRIVRVQGDGLSSILSNQRSILVRFQDALRNGTDRILIIHNQDQFASPLRRCYGNPFRRRRRPAHIGRQVNPKFGALSHFALELNKTRVTFTMPTTVDSPNPVPLSGPCCEKWVEYLICYFRGDPRTCV